MIRVRYVGWRGDLKGKTALALPGAKRGRKGEARVLVQLDNQYLDEVVPGEERELNPLAFGWHDFAADQWEEITEIE